MLTCPRCFLAVPSRSDVQFCPRCGLANFQAAAADREPMELTIEGRTYFVHERIAIGTWCAVYRCRFKDALGSVEGVFKIARDPAANDAVRREVEVLRHLHELDSQGRFTPFLPKVVASFQYDDGDSSPRQANILRQHDGIHAPDELYSLDEVRSRYPRGLDPRDMAWIWRRLLNVLGFAHAHDVIHGAVLPMHVLIEPREHKLVLIDWCSAVPNWRNRSHSPLPIVAGYLDWYAVGNETDCPAGPRLDLALAARCIIELIGGNPVDIEFPRHLEPALIRYFERCLDRGSRDDADAWKLLDEFDRLIQTLWGRRKFRVLKMPARTLR